MEEYWPDLSKSDKILVKIRPDFDPCSEPKTDRDAPETNKTQSGRFEAPYGSVAGMISPTRVYRVKSELGTNPTQTDPWTPLASTM